MADTVTESLLPCPFCGEEPRLGLGSSCEDPQVMCDMCRSSGPECGDEAEAIAAWNRRSATAEPVAVKPLEWVEEISDLWWSADHYRVESCKGGGFSARFNDPKSRAFRTLNFGVSLDEAKAAAQADYEARIRSALASPTVSDEMVDDAIAIFFEDLDWKRGLGISDKRVRMRSVLLAALGGQHD